MKFGPFLALVGGCDKQGVLPGDAGSFKLTSGWRLNPVDVTEHASFEENFVIGLYRWLELGSVSLAKQRALGLLLCPILLGFASCSSEKPSSEVTAASSGFKPADASVPGATPQVATSPSTTSKAPLAESTSAGVPPTTPKLPSFDPNQLDPRVAARSYMKLEMTSSQEPKELIRFLGQVGNALQELQSDATQRLVNKDLIMDRGMVIARMKLTASEGLAKVASIPEETSLALISKLEALGQMAQFKDVPSADELRIVAKQLASNEDPKVALQALRMQLLTAITDFQNQAATSDAVVEIATNLLSKLESPEPSIISSIVLAYEVLDSAATSPAADAPVEGTPAASNANAEACDKLVNLLEAKYRDVANRELGRMAWQMKMKRLPDFENYLKVLDTRLATSANPAEVAEAAKQMMEKVPSPWTAIALTQCATHFEYMGNEPLAKELLDIASTQVPTIKTEDLKSQIEMAIQGFEAKAGSIGKPLALDGLVDTDGKPLDPARYEGKVVLVDFWATWCGPCIAEIPNIKKVFAEKNEQGFEVIAINLDEKREDLDAFLTQQSMPWSVYVSGIPGETGMNTPLARSLSIFAIPFTMLIGRDGNVAAIHIRGETLSGKVEELLNTGPK